MKCYTFEGITLTEAQLYEKLRRQINSPEFVELKYAIFNLQEDVVKRIQESGKKYNDPTTMGVSEFLDRQHTLKQQDNTEALSYLSPAYNEENRIANSIQDLMNKKNCDKETAEKEIRAQIKEESSISDFGTIMHKLFKVVVVNKGTNNIIFRQELRKVKSKLEKISKNTNPDSDEFQLWRTISGNPPTLTIDTIMQGITEACENIYSKLLQDVTQIYLPEVPLATDNILELGLSTYTLRGNSDLIIVKQDGSIDIIEFKVSTRKFNDWYTAKTAHTDYQLATYRQILASHGLDGRKINLKVMPIYFPMGQANNIVVEELQTRTTPTVSGPSHTLDWDSGIYTKKLKQLIGTTIVPFEYDNLTLSDDITKDIKAALGEFDTKAASTRQTTKEEIIKTIWTSSYKGEIYYNVTDRITGKKYSSTSREEVLKYIDEMMKQLDQVFSIQINSLVNDIKEYQSSNTGKQTQFELLDSSKNSNTQVFNVLNGVFGKYCNTSWTLIDNLPELLDLGIFLFQNKNSGIVEVVRVTTDNIRTEINISNGSTVLGKYASNEQARKEFGQKLLSSSIGNVELIETIIAINKVIPSLSSFKLSGINIINPALGQRDIADTKNLIKHFKWLASKSGIIDNFSEKVQIANAWEIMEDSITSLLTDPDIDDTLRQITTNLNKDTANVQEKIRLIENCMQKLENAYSQLRHTNFKDKRYFNTPQEKIYLILSLALLYYKDTPVNYDGMLSQWGLHFEEIIRLLGAPWMGQYKGTLNNGFKAVGFLQGLDMSTPTSMPSTNLSALYQYWSSSFQHIREFTLRQTLYLNKITTDYYKRHGYSNFSRAVINSSAIWEPFIERDNTGKFTKELRIVDPKKANLSTQDTLFLNQMLWEIQKFILPNITREQQSWRFEDHQTDILNLPEVQEAMNSGSYYQLPLRRAAAFDRMRNLRKQGGIETAFKRYWDTLQDDYDPRQLHTSAQKIISNEFGEVTEMYNQYRISAKARNLILEKENVYDFETDLDLLGIDVAFQYKRKEIFDECLTHAAAMATVFHYLGETSDANFDAELENMDDERKVILLNEPPIKKELADVSKSIGVMKRVNSLLVLAMRPLQFVKEITYGQFTNYSRAWGLQGSGQKVSAKSIFKANKLVWGIQIASWIKSLTGEEDIASFSMIQLINKLYGIANEDLNMISRNNSLSRLGVKHGLSKFMYIWSSCPDFFNRMTLFIAKMIEEGCFDAHFIDKDRMIAYDIKKDKRFSKLVKLGINAKSTDPEYLKQLSLYRTMVNQFIQEGYTKPDGSQLDPFSPDLYLPKAFTNKETLALKEISDQAYGFYDHEAKSLNDHKFFGLVFKQFMAFWTAKTQLWLRAPGSQTTRGKWVPRVEDGKPIYRKYYTDPETGRILVELTTENPDGTLEQDMKWEGDYVEGLFYSVMYTLRDVFTFKWSDIVGNEQRLGNLKLALHDILVGIILMQILKLIFSGGTGKMKDMNPAERTLIRAMQDTGPQSILGLSLTPSFIATAENIRQDLPNLLSEDRDISNFIEKRLGAVKDFVWSQH